jgi:hypothetical protein
VRRLRKWAVYGQQRSFRLRCLPGRTVLGFWRNGLCRMSCGEVFGGRRRRRLQRLRRGSLCSSGGAFSVHPVRGRSHHCRGGRVRMLGLYGGGLPSASRKHLVHQLRGRRALGDCRRGSIFRVLRVPRGSVLVEHRRSGLCRLREGHCRGHVRCSDASRLHRVLRGPVRGKRRLGAVRALPRRQRSRGFGRRCVGFVRRVLQGGPVRPGGKRRLLGLQRGALLHRLCELHPLRCGYVLGCSSC